MWKKREADLDNYGVHLLHEIVVCKYLCYHVSVSRKYLRITLTYLIMRWRRVYHSAQWESANCNLDNLKLATVAICNAINYKLMIHTGKYVTTLLAILCLIGASSFLNRYTGFTIKLKLSNTTLFWESIRYSKVMTPFRMKVLYRWTKWWGYRKQ